MSKWFVVCAGLVLAANLSYASQVGSCQSANPQYPTIQAAVNNTAAGGTVNVCPGTYPEQITITKNLTIQGININNGQGSSGAHITTPAGGMQQNATSLSPSGNPYDAHVLVQNATKVNLTNLTVDSLHDGVMSCSPYLVGVLYQNASGVLTDMTVKNQILEDGYTGCQGGLSILVQSGGGGHSTVAVNDSMVSNFAKNGITGTEVGTTLNVARTKIVGIGLTNLVAQNGFEIGYGATGSIIDSTLSDFSYSDPTSAASTGIINVGAPKVTVKNNVITNTDIGIYSGSQGTDGSASQGTISNNEVSATHTWDGIVLCSNSNTVNANVISDSDEAGIFIEGDCQEGASGTTGKSNKITNNVINRACAGLEYGYGATQGTNSASATTFFNTDINRSFANSCPEVQTTATFNALAAGGKKGKSRPETVR